MPEWVTKYVDFKTAATEVRIFFADYFLGTDPTLV